MSELELKYNLLDPIARQEVLDFIDFLLTKGKKTKNLSNSVYKKKILNVSVWSESDIDEMIQNQQKFDQWKAPEW